MRRMRVNKITLLGLLMVVAINCCHPQSSEELLIGVWRGVKQELRDGETGEKYTLDGKPYKVNVLLEFQNDGTVIDLVINEKFHFSVEDRLLNIGNRHYVIEKLTNNELVLLDFSKDDNENPFAFRIYYERVNDRAKEVK